MAPRRVEGSILTVLMAAVFAMSLVPVQAWAASGRVNDANDGSITINNAEDGETYNAYRIFTLLSFDDADPTTNNHTDNAETPTVDETDKYSYGLKAGSQWEDFFTTDAGANYFSVDKTHPITVGTDTYYPVSILNNGPLDSEKTGTTVTPVADEDEKSEWTSNNAKVQEFAKAALAYAKRKPVTENKTPVTASGTDAATHATDDGTVTITFPNLTYGYYLVDSTLGTFVALDTTNKTVTMQEKNEKPTVDKRVKARLRDTTAGTDNRTSGTGQWPSDEDSIWVKETDYDIGDVVTFKTKVGVPKGAKDYKLYDVMEAGLTLKSTTGEGADDFKVYANTNSASPDNFLAVTATGNYTITAPSSTAGCDFDIAFTNAFLDGLAYGEDNIAYIEVEYKATLNRDAVVAGDDETNLAQGTDTEIAAAKLEGGPADVVAVTNIARDHGVDNDLNTNSTLLTFGNGSSTEWSNADVETFQFDVVKTDEANKLLAAAKFNLYPQNAAGTGADTTPIALVKTADSTNRVNVYRKADPTAATAETADALILTEAGMGMRFRGLEVGKYYLREIEAPLGYNALGGDIVITVNADGTFSCKMPGTAESDTTFTPWNATIDGATNAYTSGGVHVINQTGPELPSTGGIGTTIFYVAGTVLVVGAAVMLVAKRRMGAEA